MMRSSAIIVLTVVIALAGIAGAQTDVRLRLSDDRSTTIRVGFAEPEAGPEDDVVEYHTGFIRVLREDLEMSGYFEIVDDIKADDPHAVVGIDTKSRSAELSFEVDLKDRASDQMIFRRRYGSAPDRVASVAHIVADDIVYALTGRQGIANSQMAFVAGERGGSHLYTMHIDGSDLRKLTRAASIVMSPAWSPDGTRLAYVSYESGTPAIYVADMADNTTTRFTAFEGMNATPAWSPDGRKIALTLSKDGNPEIYAISLDGKLRKRLTNYSGIDCSPTWAPNGFELAFTSDRTGSPQIYVADLEGGNPRRVTFEGNYNTSPAWSPEGDLIAYVARVDGSFQICTVDPFGITTTVLTEHGSNEHPNWSGDGMHIVYASQDRGDSGIYIMNRDGSGKRRIFSGLTNPRDPAWSALPRYAKPEPLEG